VLPIVVAYIPHDAVVRCLDHVPRCGRNENLAVNEVIFSRSVASVRENDGPGTTPNLLRVANRGSSPIYEDSSLSSKHSTTCKSLHNSGIIQLECISAVFEGRELGIL
jgi:hypothetical protein